MYHEHGTTHPSGGHDLIHKEFGKAKRPQRPYAYGNPSAAEHAVPHGGSTDVGADLTPDGDEEPRRSEMRQQHQETTFVVQVRQDDDQRRQEEQTTHDVGHLPPAPPA